MRLNAGFNKVLFHAKARSREVKTVVNLGLAVLFLGACRGIYEELKEHKIEVSSSEIEGKLRENLLKGTSITSGARRVTNTPTFRLGMK